MRFANLKCRARSKLTLQVLENFGLSKILGLYAEGLSTFQITGIMSEELGVSLPNSYAAYII